MFVVLSVVGLPALVAGMVGIFMLLYVGGRWADVPSSSPNNFVAKVRPFKKGEAHQRVRRWAGRPAGRLAGRPAGRPAGRSAGRPAGRPGGARVVSGAEDKNI